jgi:arylsulfatase A-like enzyme
MKTQRPNVIYVVCHDIGRHLNCYGTPVESPFFDKFAEEGVVFTNAFCNSPACSPSRGCALTGRYAHSNGLMGLVNRGWSMPGGTRTITDVFNEADYATAHFGFQHERSEARLNRYQVEGYRENTDKFCENAFAQATAYLKERRGSAQPFYLNVGTIEVHASKWQESPLNLGRPEVYGRIPAERAHVPSFLPDTPGVREAMGRFEGAIRFLDREFRKFVEAADALGYGENSVFVFTTDHGIAGLRAKGTVYDRGLEIAAIIRMPKKRLAGQRVNDLIQNIDFAPTLLEAAGIPVPENMQGKSFWPRLSGRPYAPHKEIFTERNYHGGVVGPLEPPPPPEENPAYDPMRAVRTERFHYIRNFDKKAKRRLLPEEFAAQPERATIFPHDAPPHSPHPRPLEELYDLTTDPREFRNLAGRSETAAVQAELARKLDAWMRETDDPILKGPIPDRLHGWPKANPAD